MGKGNLTCFICGGPLEPTDRHRGQCSNPDCASGGAPYLCEFCEEYSIVREGVDLRCFNPECGLSNTLRQACSECGKVSLIDFMSGRICLNRRCKVNTQLLVKCVSCGRRSALKTPDHVVCIRGRCERFLQPLVDCFFCGNATLDLESKSCVAPDCDMPGIPMDFCQDCGKRSWALDDKQCLNPECLRTGTDAVGTTGLLTKLHVMPSKAAPGLGATTLPHETPTAPGTGGKLVTQLTMHPAGQAPKRDKPSGPGVGVRTSRALTIKASGSVDIEKPGAPAGASPVAGGQGSRPRKLPPGLEGSPMAAAYSFIMERVLEDSGPASAIYLVVGMPGSGKTTFLTMFGELLRCRGSKYHFPYDGIDVRPVQIDDFLRPEDRDAGVAGTAADTVRRHVRDLVFDFAQKTYAESISKMQWPEPTRSSEDGALFLVTELTRHQKTVARIVTLDVSGEDYDAALGSVKEYDPSSAAGGGVHRILMELMDAADGLVVLMPPGGRGNDETYRDFFLAVRAGLEPRALNVLAVELASQVEVAGATAPSAEGDSPHLTLMMRSAMRSEDTMLEQAELKRKQRKEWSDRVRRVRKRLDDGDVEALGGEDGEALKRLEKAAVKLGAQPVLKARSALQSRGVDKGRILDYYRGFAEFAERELERLVDEVAKEDGTGIGSTAEDIATAGERDRIEKALWDVRRQRKLSEDFKVAIGPDFFAERPVRRFAGLKDIAVVFTKTDMYAATHPPEDRPARDLPGCKIHLDVIEDYLRLLGGAIRYYNASATGYSLLCDAAYVPGPENTHAPISVCEPFFDMLGIR